MPKLLVIFIIALFFCQMHFYNSTNVALAGTGTSPTMITISSRYLNLIAGGSTVTLTAKISPITTTNKSVTWHSSDIAVASVSSSGLVTPISAGIANIQVKTVDGNYADYCIINVTKQSVIGITLTPSQENLKVGATLALSPIITPSNASNKTINWTSSNLSVASISHSGIITAIAPGSTGIVGTTVDGNFKVYLLVNVPEVVASVTLTQNSLKFNVGDYGVTLIAKLMPTTLSTREVIWSSSNNAIASVDANGKVTPLSSGAAVITATALADSTKKATCSVTVAATNNSLHPGQITLNLHQKSLIVGGPTLALTEVISPITAVNKTVTWRSSDQTIATVSSSGLVTPISAGNVNIEVRTVDGGCSDYCIINVTAQPLKGITLNHSQATIKVGSTLALSPIITPSNASNKTINWSSSNPTVASISHTGVITALSPGSTGIVGTTVDGNFKVYFLVNVPEVVTSVSLTQKSLKFNVGNSGVTLMAKLMPTNLSIREVIWSSSNNTVASVDANGKVTPVSSGTAVITATSLLDTTKKGTCSVTVLQK